MISMGSRSPVMVNQGNGLYEAKIRLIKMADNYEEADGYVTEFYMDEHKALKPCRVIYDRRSKAEVTVLPSDDDRYKTIRNKGKIKQTAEIINDTSDNYQLSHSVFACDRYLNDII
jgi:hypothetical protein